MGKPVVLYYNLASLDQSKLLAVCGRQGLLPRRVDAAELSLTLEELLTAPAPSYASMRPPAFHEAMLVMAGVYGPSLDQFLTEMRRCRLQIPLKAVLTAENRHWSSLRLFRTLKREQEWMQKKK